jgi:CRISPR-associated endoribonuclease Cas6
MIQSMLYKNLPTYFSRFLHDLGFFYNKRKFKLYTFSNIISKQYKIFKDSKRILFSSPILLYLSSAIQEIPQVLAEKFLKKESIGLGKNILNLESIEMISIPSFKSNEIKIKTLSPITVYRTFNKETGKKFYQFYNPENIEFSSLIKENIRKKYELISGKNLKDFSFEIHPINQPRKALIKYKDFLIEGYDGKFLIKMDPEIFLTVYDAGLGAKNSQGFGMIEVMSEID